MDNTNSQSTSADSSQQAQNQEEQVKQATVSKTKVKDGGFFAPEKRGIQKGIVGGIAMIVIAVVWFVAGYAAGYIFYYPPILLVIGLYALIKGIITGNIRGEKAEQIASTTVTADTTNIRSYPRLFDRDRYGLNTYVGIGYLAASILAIFAWRIVYGIIGQQSHFSPPLDYYIIIFAFNILEAALLLFLSHSISKEWALPVFFGLGMIVIGIGQSAVFSTIKIENMNFAAPFDLSSLIFNFIWAFFFMGGLVLIVKLWGPHLWSFILGLMLTFCVREIVMQLYYVTRGSSFFFGSLLSPAVSGLIFGGLIFAGLA
ncbi:MAG: hypothetical protein MUC94_17900, partial [bacterium]|nr:hypothetical protein [bacterium]